MKSKVWWMIGLQVAVFLYACTGYFSKMAGRHPFLSLPFCLYYGCEMLILAGYAVLWQQFLKRFALTTCYASRAMSAVWTMLIAFIVFQEKITFAMIVGSMVIMAGVFLVVSDHG